ncbi:DUF1036 domain-containing protein [Leptolyngbya sp. PL-A3]|uniref:DUF1036 domain-containing protein n=1 Tax=Leptolyngbya sp. PL-A3 TaxID=2933911 RepID=UPI003299459B
MKLKSLMVAVGTGIATCLSSFMFATSADAALTVCNRAGSRAFVAISYYADGTAWTRGWVQLEPGACDIAFAGRVSNSDIGVYAETFNAVVESGDVRRCVIWVQHQQSWTIRGADRQDRCIGTGREMKGFSFFRTGASPDYTYEVYD